MGPLHIYKRYYRIYGAVEGCPCCVSDEDKKKLSSKSLRFLEEEQLSRYASKTMTTWGTENDFKYFLPRIFELTATSDFIVDTFVILGKLEYANWKTWPPNEYHAVKNFLFEWAVSILHDGKGYLDNTDIEEIALRLEEIDPLLDAWNTELDQPGFVNLIDAINGNNLFGNRHFKNTNFRNTFEKWIMQKKEFIEQAFFYYVQKNPDFAGEISQAYDILSWSNISHD